MTMHFFGRLIIFAAYMLLDVSQPSQRHFGVMRMTLVALDVLLPLSTSGAELLADTNMGNQNLSLRSTSPNFAPENSESGVAAQQHHARPTSTSTEAAADSTAEADDLMPVSSDVTHSTGQAERGDAPAVTPGDLHVSQMTKKEREQAEEILRQKYGAVGP